MFEGNPPGAPGAREAEGESRLHELSWSDLRARLEAAADLRRALRAAAVRDLASFDAQSARLIAAQEGKHVVNLDDLGSGKANGCIGGEPAGTGTGSDPRK